VTDADLPGSGELAVLAGRMREGPCEVEIGCGNGHFLAAYAAGRPETLCIGIDIKPKRCQKAREKAERHGLSNVAIWQGPAESFLDGIPPGCVTAFHIYFPDPWPKSRHRKRRFFTMERLRLMHGLLREGGRLYFGTDFFDYFIQAKVLVALHGGFRLTEEPAPQPVLTSLYGQRFVSQRKDIRLFTAVRLSADQQGEQQEYQGRVHDDGEAQEAH
jgi:tRNA (guanine-N7-)-methyltransferase